MLDLELLIKFLYSVEIPKIKKIIHITTDVVTLLDSEIYNFKQSHQVKVKNFRLKIVSLDPQRNYSPCSLCRNVECL